MARSGGGTATPVGVAIVPSGSDDTTNIQTAIDTAYANGGGEVLLSHGTFKVTAVSMRSNVHLRGQGIGATIVKLNASANDNVITSEGFATYTGTNTTNSAQPINFGLYELTIDGNKANNTSGRGISVYGRSFFFHHIQVQNCAGVGMWLEGNSTTDMESRISHFKVVLNDGGGIIYNGPHDAVFEDGIVERNGSGLANQYGIGITTAGGSGGVFTDVHVWSGDTTWSWYLTRAAKLTNCQGEGSTTGQLYIGASYTEVRGGAFFNTALNTSGPAIVLGTAAVDYVSQSVIDTVVRNHTVPFSFANDAGYNWVRLLIEFEVLTDQPPYTGGPSDSTRIDIVSTGPQATSHERNGYSYIPSSLGVSKTSATAFTVSGDSSTTRFTVDTSGTPAKGMVYCKQKSGDTGNILTVTDGSGNDKLGVNSTGVVFGGGSAISYHRSGTATWDPASIADGAMTSTTVSVTNAAIGNTVAVGFSNAVPAGAILAGAVTASGTVTVTLFNKTGGNLDLASGTVRADVWAH